ncbi:MAG: hypothetical protein OEY87_01245 [Gammaproteobacteria bacterium]|nr:hypothetical protein [Gammaproteobacteria bacterium]MDH5734722.1 hypothetical protein [Gammaproteobacteria bacterium]
MDEQEYRKTYSEINNLRCVFEKALCSLGCHCSKGQQFRLADRIGYGCSMPGAQQQCAKFIEHLRKQTRFVFKLNEITGPLPHNKEIRVQNGGMLGLQKLVLGNVNQDTVTDIFQLLQTVVKEYGDIDKLPYDILMQSVMAYKARPKRRSGK